MGKIIPTRKYDGRCNINMYLGDCEEAFNSGKKWELAIVDPPYGIDIKSQKFTKPSRPNSYIGDPKHKCFDDSSPPNKEYFDNLINVSKNQIVWGANYLCKNLPISGCWIFWNKMNGSGSHFADGEFAWTSFSSASRKVDVSQFHGTRGGKDRIHITQKPVALYKWILKNYAGEGDKILDTHGGSMSIAIACWDLGFDLDIWEIDEEYFDMAVKRFEKHIAQGLLF